MNKLASDDLFRDAFVQAIKSEALSATYLLDALKANTAFSAAQRNAILDLLASDKPRVRFAAVHVLSGNYFEPKEAQPRLASLMNDPEADIREVAERLLRKMA
jgi:hypothetical protein